MNLITYQVFYETPADPGNHTEMTMTDWVEAPSLEEAVEASLNKFVAAGQITLTGIDLMDSFHGLDRDTYKIGKKTPEQFREEIRSMIKSVSKMTR